MKFCSKCNDEKDDLCFSAKQAWCKACVKIYNKQYYTPVIPVDKETKEAKETRHQLALQRNKERSKKWHLEHKEKVREHQKKNIRTIDARFRNAKKSAVKRTKEWLLSIEQYQDIIRLDCYYCEGYFGKVETGSGLDRIDNNNGYNIYNVVSCCYTCNKIKNDTLTMDETRKIVKVIIEMRTSK